MKSTREQSDCNLGLISLLVRLWNFVVQDKSLIFTVLFVIVFGGVVLQLLPLCLKQIVENMLASNYDAARELIFLYVAIMVIANVLLGVSRFLQKLISARNVHRMRVAAHCNLLSFRCSFFDKHSTGDLLSRCTVDASNSNVITGALLHTTYNVVYIIGPIVFMLALNRQLAIIVIACVAILALLVSVLTKKIRRTMSRVRAHDAEAVSLLANHISCFSMLKCYRRTSAALNELRLVESKGEKCSLSVAQLVSVYQTLSVALYAAMIIGLIYWGGGLIRTYGSPVGLLVAFLDYGQKMLWPSFFIADAYRKLKTAVASAERFLILLDVEERERDIASIQGQNRIHSSMVRCTSFATLQYKNVHFSYDAKHDVLCGLNLTIRKGSWSLLIGPTGSGKSTVAKLALRMYEPQSGTVAFEGMNIGSVPLGWLRKQIGLVSQEAYVFGGTVADNVCVADKSLRVEDVNELWTRAGLHELLPLSQMVSTAGVNLSPGERQLIALGRTLTTCPKIVFLDEPTANLDAVTEEHILGILRESLTESTVIVVSHRAVRTIAIDETFKIENGIVVS